LAKEKDEERTAEPRSEWDCYLVVPPFLRYAAGPLLGPATLEGAARDRGFKVSTLDLNIRYIRSIESVTASTKPSLLFYGDHAKPPGGLSKCARRFWSTLEEGFEGVDGITVSRIKKAWYSHSQLYAASQKLMGLDLATYLKSQMSSLPRPSLVGVSVMWPGQIVPAIIVSRISKDVWPEVHVVWGGAHVTAIVQEIVQDCQFGRFVDGFLPGHCEESFLHLIASAWEGRLECPGLVTPGQGIPGLSVRSIEPPPLPSFPDLNHYGIPKLTLPVELSVGCAYALCAFCTYPAVEGKYRRFTIESLERLVQIAQEEHAAISIKDSLVTPERLGAIGEVIAGRVEWSACTKLSQALDSRLLPSLSRNGCRTLEVGLESLNEETQKRINKIQSMGLLDGFLAAAAASGISVVINYIIDFPWEDLEESQKLLKNLRRRIESQTGLTARVELNHFNLERLSPMAFDPSQYGMRIVRTWPWSSLLEWIPLSNDSPSFPSQLNEEVR
jgi:hypothetical protein